MTPSLMLLNSKAASLRLSAGEKWQCAREIFMNPRVVKAAAPLLLFVGLNFWPRSKAFSSGGPERLSSHYAVC